MSTGNATGRVRTVNPTDRVQIVGFIVLVGIQKRRERCQISKRITIGQILVIGPNAREIVGGQKLRADRGVHAETIAGDRLAVNGSAGDRCVLDHRKFFLCPCKFYASGAEPVRAGWHGPCILLKLLRRVKGGRCDPAHSVG